MTTLRTGLLVVGAGLAGYAAALEAARLGAQVLLLEKTARPGGSSVMSSGCMAFAGTGLQRAAGVVDTPELLRRDLLEVGQHENDPDLVQAYASHQGDTCRWLGDLGVQFSAAIESSAGQSVPRVHTVDPAQMLAQLAAACRQTGRVTLATSTRASRLRRAGAAGAVTGVQAEGPEGAVEVAAADGVVLASGGFSRNLALVHRFAPQLAPAVFVGGEGASGDGLLMAWALGADLRDMAFIKGTFGKHPDDTGNHHPCLAVYKGAIAVNRDGLRFADESLSYKLLGDAVLRQPGHAGFQVFDQPVFDRGDERVRIFDFARRLEQGLLLQAPTLPALARLAGLPEAALCETVARYNSAVEAGRDPLFGRDSLVHGQGALHPIAHGPFYAYPSTAAVFGTYCGLRVDAAMRVIDVFGQPIERLYAAGEVVGGLHGGAYMTGSALGKAAVFGRLAARSAVGA